MGYASKSGRASTSASSPDAFAVCSRCGIWHNYSALRWQYQWAGTNLQNIFIRVCNECYDQPQPQLRVIVVPGDPQPKVFATPEPFLEDETNFRIISQPPVYDPVTGLQIPPDTKLLTQDGQNVTLIPVGAPTGLDPNAIMPLNGRDHFGVPIIPSSVIGDVLGRVIVNSVAPHGLLDGSQVSVLQLADPGSNGFFSVTVVHAESFLYQPVKPPPVGSLLTSATKIVTAKVGLPRGYPEIPLI